MNKPILLLLVVSFQANAQQLTHVKGKVVDAASARLVAKATVTLTHLLPKIRNDYSGR